METLFQQKAELFAFLAARNWRCNVRVVPSCPLPGQEDLFLLLELFLAIILLETIALVCEEIVILSKFALW